MDQSLSCAQSAADPRKLANLGRGHVCSSLHPIYRREPECARSEEHTSELQSLMRISYAVFCLKKKNKQTNMITTKHNTKITNYKNQTSLQTNTQSNNTKTDKQATISK